MGMYARPKVDEVEFRDDSGEVIEYGNRWAHQYGPPEDSYSVEDHSERFAPLHVVAEALVDHLVTSFDVDVEDGAHLVKDLRFGPTADETVRAVRLVPRSPRGAPLTIVLTKYPAVHLHAGVLFSTSYPSCGCNACDETWQSAAEELEWQALAITGGGFSEAVSEPRRPKLSFSFRGGLEVGMGQTVSHRLRALDGSTEQSGESRADAVPPALLASAQNTLDALRVADPEGSWESWPTRAGASSSQETA